MTQVNSQNLPIVNTTGQITQIVQDELANSGFSVYYNSIPAGQSGVVIKDYYGDDCCNGCSCNIILVLQGTATQIQNMINILSIPPYNLSPYTGSGTYGPNAYLLKKAGIDCRKPVSVNIPCGCVYMGTYDLSIEQFPIVGNPNGIYFDKSDNKFYRRDDQLLPPAYVEINISGVAYNVTTQILTINGIPYQLFDGNYNNLTNRPSILGDASISSRIDITNATTIAVNPDLSQRKVVTNGSQILVPGDLPKYPVGNGFLTTHQHTVIIPFRGEDWYEDSKNLFTINLPFVAQAGYKWTLTGNFDVKYPSLNTITGVGFGLNSYGVTTFGQYNGSVVIGDIGFIPFSVANTKQIPFDNNTIRNIQPLATNTSFFRDSVSQGDVIGILLRATVGTSPSYQMSMTSADVYVNFSGFLEYSKI